jgi:hypothetical protein
VSNPWAGVVAGAGQGVKAFNDWNTSRDIDKAVGLSIKNRGRIQDKIDTRLFDEINTLRGSDPEAERTKAMGEFMSQFAAAQGNFAGDAGAPAGGERAQEMAGDNAAALSKYGRREADVTSRIAAPMRTRLNEGLSMGRAGSDIDLLIRRMSGQTFLDKLRIERKSRKNPWLDMLGEAMIGAGQAMGGGGGGMMGGGGGGGGAASATQAGGSMSSAKGG